MLRNYFLDWNTGLLPRLSYLKLQAVLAISILAFGVLTGVLIGVAENLMGGELQYTQQILSEKLGLPFMLLLAAFIVSLTLASLNITAKRIRDMGLAAWTVVTVAILLFIVVLVFAGPVPANLLQAAFVVSLLAIKSSALRNARK